MKRISLSSFLIFALGLMLSACGGGEGSATPVPTTAVLTLSTAVTSTIPSTTTINSYNVTITLPAGVTVKTMPNSSETGTGVVTASGMASGALIYGVYTPATGIYPGTVGVYVTSATGFDAGEFCKVSCDFAAGNAPTASDFVPLTLDDATGWDSSTGSNVLNMQTLFGMSLTAKVVIQ